MGDGIGEAIPVMPSLPGEVGQDENDRQGETEPWPSTGELVTLVGGEQPDQDGRPKPDHGVLRLETDAEHQPEQKPLSWVGAAQEPNEQQAGDGPDQLVEADRLKEDVGPDEKRRDQHGQRRERLRQPIVAQLSGDQGRDDDDGGAGEDREQAQRRQRAGEDRLVESRQ